MGENPSSFVFVVCFLLKLRHLCLAPERKYSGQESQLPDWQSASGRYSGDTVTRSEGMVGP